MFARFQPGRRSIIVLWQKMLERARPSAILLTDTVYVSAYVCMYVYVYVWCVRDALHVAVWLCNFASLLL